MSENINLFGEDITEEIKLKERKEKFKQRAIKAAKTRKLNAEKKKKIFEKMFIIANSKENIFGEKYTDEQIAEAKDYILKHLKKY